VAAELPVFGSPSDDEHDATSVVAATSAATLLTSADEPIEDAPALNMTGGYRRRKLITSGVCYDGK
jgi:hypothetical protein